MVSLVTKRAQPSYFVPALEKGLDILEALANASIPQSLADLARTLNRTSSELFRMIDALEKRSYIFRDPVSGGYHLTLKLYELAHIHSPVDQLLRAADYPMRELSQNIHESCHLSLLSGSVLLVVAQAESSEPVRLSIEVGSRVAPLQTVSGKLLLAFLERDAQQRFLADDAVYAKLSGAGRKALHREFAIMRRDGWFMAESTRRIGLDISHIVGNPVVGVSAALGVPLLAGGANQGKEKSIIPALRQCAHQITDLLGVTRGV
ncbi:MAG TPA: IclR family transcriptional regulator C-terminal domain-containing protein [Bryobacteraceae bacterium]|nr:IclR family transcriptional regulator C-terminal domain-containing protein [Bryobacteraceae bacterium]